MISNTTEYEKAQKALNFKGGGKNDLYDPTHRR